MEYISIVLIKYQVESSNSSTVDKHSYDTFCIWSSEK